MEYIPISRIQNNLEEINNLPLPNEIVRYIKEYCDEFLPIPIESVGDDIDKFWINLGTETCNLVAWNIKCWRILTNSFGLAKKFHSIPEGLLDSLCCQLDNLVNKNYPLSINSIQTDGRDIPIVSIFYRCRDIIEYPIEYTIGCRRRRKTITSQDKKYMMKFIERMNIYLNYLEKNVDKLPVNTRENITDINKKIKKLIKKLTQKCEKMYQLVNDLTVQ